MANLHEISVGLFYNAHTTSYFVMSSGSISMGLYPNFAFVTVSMHFSIVQNCQWKFCIYNTFNP